MPHDDALLAATGLDPHALARQQRRLLAQGQTPWLNALLAERMAERLEWIKAEVRQAWAWQGLWGGGQQALQRRYPQASIRALEDAALPLLEQRRRWWQRAAWLRADEAPPNQAQLVWAPLGLLAAPDPRARLARWHELLAVDGFLMFSSLGPDSFIELRQLYTAEGFGELAPRWVDLHDVGDQLLEAGFAEPVMDQERLTLTWADAASLWDDLHALGGNIAPDRHPGLRTPRWRQAWDARVNQALRQPDGRLALTLEFVCGHALKPEPRLPGESTVPLSALKDQLALRRKPY
jgi:malonyl-CoA O-methyltransferase